MPTNKQIYKKGDIVDIKGLGTYKKERPTNVTMAKLGEFCQHALASLYTNKGKILAKRRSVPTEHTERP